MPDDELSLSDWSTLKYHRERGKKKGKQTSSAISGSWFVWHFLQLSCLGWAASRHSHEEKWNHKADMWRKNKGVLIQCININLSRRSRTWKRSPCYPSHHLCVALVFSLKWVYRPLNRGCNADPHSVASEYPFTSSFLQRPSCLRSDSWNSISYS